MIIVPVISVDGEPSRELAGSLVRLQIEQSLDELAEMRADFIDGHTLDVGRAIEVSLGTVARHRSVFTGEITAIEFVLDENEPPVVMVSAAGAAVSQTAWCVPRAVRGNELVSARAGQKARAFVTVGSTTGSPDHARQRAAAEHISVVPATAASHADPVTSISSRG